MVESTSIVNILVIIAFVLLVGVSIGIIYLSSLEWSERRRNAQQKRAKQNKR